MKLYTFIPDIVTYPPGMALPRTAWVLLNRLRTGVGRFRSCLHKCDMASSAACECGAEEQNADHVVFQCPIHRPLRGLHGLTVLDDETVCPARTPRSSAAKQSIVTTHSNDEVCLCDL